MLKEELKFQMFHLSLIFFFHGHRKCSGFMISNPDSRSDLRFLIRVLNFNFDLESGFNRLILAKLFSDSTFLSSYSLCSNGNEVIMYGSCFEGKFQRAGFLLSG